MTSAKLLSALGLLTCAAPLFLTAVARADGEIPVLGVDEPGFGGDVPVIGGEDPELDGEGGGGIGPIGATTGCYVLRSAVCLTHPSLPQQFSDSHEGSDRDARRCARRAREYSEWYGDAAGATAAAFFAQEGSSPQRCIPHPLRALSVRRSAPGNRDSRSSPTPMDAAAPHGVPSACGSTRTGVSIRRG
jgi:hypothetical protein